MRYASKPPAPASSRSPFRAEPRCRWLCGNATAYSRSRKRISASASCASNNFGSYACRNVYDREAAPRSRHATADALDVAAFVLGDGRRIHVLGAWNAGDAQGRFLRDVRDAACRYFDAVLGPDYNAAHRNHLHLDRGPYRVCR